MSSVLSSIRKADWLIIGIVVAITLSASASFLELGSRSDVIIHRQIFFLLVGIFVMFLLSFFDYRIFKNYSLPSLLVYLSSIVFLMPAFASQRIRGINAWITFFDRYQFQPSEFAKLALVIVLAKYFSQKYIEINRPRHIIASGVYTAIPAFLTLMQPDLGSMAVFVMIWLAMLFLAGARKKHFFVLFVAMLLAASMAWLFVLEPYQKNRIIAFINPNQDTQGIGYHTLQSKITIGSGVLTGYASDIETRTIVVPEPYTDFAFALFGQNFGFLGIICLLSLFAVLFWRMGVILQKTSNNFSKFFVLGFIALILSHLFINIGMNLGLLPITGIPLSFLSYGGSHFITLMIGLGIVQSIRIRNNV